MSMFQSKKPFSAVTVTVENLTSESYEEEDLSGIPELVDVITLQATGPSEAARAIRKKLKYGNVHRQIRALVILDGLIQNAGERFQRTFVDEPLLERLRVCGTSDLSDVAYAGRPGLDSLARLHRELPKRKQAVTQERSRVLRETEENPFVDDEQEAAAKAARDARNASGPSSSTPTSGSTFGHSSTKSSSGPSAFFGSSKDKKKEKEKDKAKGKRKPFNLEAEKEQMKSVIADSSIAATNLMNALQSINREVERISENQTAVERFEACKLLRRKVLRYVHHVEEEQWLGGLLHANDELVHALMSFEQFDRSIDADSDSDDELAEQAHLYRMATIKGKEAMAKTASQSPTASQPPDLSELNISTPVHAAPPRPPPMSKPHSNPPPKPPRPVAAPQDEDDEDDPFGDSHALETPMHERDQPKW
ncbi:LSB5-possible role in the regulation of actin cytoskeletal organization [Fusarium mexicanum]|uniref:LSB5-possible role in the regulation of actin cytoskeletal organization n=1 Tax=Fusarium mexicanum TaxID=751941 RepID=A0A8H5J4G6_9HYPO|nr:LSB5-possible role in the regulation of actin cytoskeletal organization [Fusarium mexicanum]